LSFLQGSQRFVGKRSSTYSVFLFLRLQQEQQLQQQEQQLQHQEQQLQQQEELQQKLCSNIAVTALVTEIGYKLFSTRGKNARKSVRRK